MKIFKVRVKIDGASPFIDRLVVHAPDKKTAKEFILETYAKKEIFSTGTTNEADEEDSFLSIHKIEIVESNIDTNKVFIISQKCQSDEDADYYDEEQDAEFKENKKASPC
jgi:hypothetical protein